MYSFVGVAYRGDASALKIEAPTDIGTSHTTMVSVELIVVQPKSMQPFARVSLVVTTGKLKKASVAPDGVTASGASASAGVPIRAKLVAKMMECLFTTAPKQLMCV
jgi:hypothetical protein